MLLLCFFSICLLEPVSKIKLDLAEVSGFSVRLNDVFIEKDGSFIGLSSHELWHWDAHGQLIQRIGKKGSGPGEFSYITEALWDGEHYWIIDGQQLRSLIFDRSGQFLFAQPLYFRQLIRAGDQFFTLDYSQIRFDPVTYPPVVQEIGYDISNGQIQMAKVDEPFKKVTKRQMDFFFNFKLLWIALEPDRILVVDQLEPKINVYSLLTREKEQRVPIANTFLPDYIPIQARRWVEPPTKMPRERRSRESLMRWFSSFSRINFFGRLGEQEQFIVAYLTPDPEDDLGSLQVIQIIDSEGRIAGPVFEGEGMIVGSKERNVFIYNEEEMEEDTEHILSVYQF